MNGSHKDLRIEEEAADWLLQLESDTSERSCEEFIQWLKDSPRHVEEFLLASAAARVARQVGPRAGYDVEALLREVSPNVVPLDAGRGARSGPDGAANHAGTARVSHGRPRRSLIRKLAAAIAAVAVGAGLWLHVSPVERYETLIGEQRSIKLGDGSVVFLNTRSRVKVDLGKHFRDVRLLSGEALFNVTRDERRPFRVYVDDAVIQVLGTQFNVYRREGMTMVSVVEGRVAVSSASNGGQAHAATVRKGEQLEVRKSNVLAKRPLVNPSTAVAWRERRLVFQNDTLASMAGEFNRYNRMQIVVEGTAARQRRFTAVFNADEPQALVKFLDGEPQLRVQETRDGVRIISSR